MLSGLQNLSLTVVTMEGYKRDIFWSDTDLPWISPSPNMVDLDTALLSQIFLPPRPKKKEKKLLKDTNETAIF